MINRSSGLYSRRIIIQRDSRRISFTINYIRIVLFWLFRQLLWTYHLLVSKISIFVLAFLVVYTEIVDLILAPTFYKSLNYNRDLQCIGVASQVSVSYFYYRSCCRTIQFQRLSTLKTPAVAGSKVEDAPTEVNLAASFNIYKYKRLNCIIKIFILVIILILVILWQNQDY